MDKRRNLTAIFRAATAAPIASDGESRTGADRKARSVPVGRVLEPLRESRAERAGVHHGGDELLQPSLQGDSRMENLARLIARLSALPVSVPIVNLFDRVDASALPSLGEQFHIMGVEGWNLAGSETARRALLKRAIELHRHKGTPWAVRTALETALPTEASIKEWFAYDGDPFFFRVRLDVSELGMDESGMTSAVRLIFDYKNVRSWLECLETFTRRPLPIAIATAGVMRTLNRVRLHFPPRPVPPARVHVATAGIMRTQNRVRLHFPPEPAAPARPRIAVTSLIRSRCRLCPFTPPRPVPAGRGRIALALLTMTRSRVCPQP